jgi:hypothetical protein
MDCGTWLQQPCRPRTALNRRGRRVWVCRSHTDRRAQGRWVYPAPHQPAWHDMCMWLTGRTFGTFGSQDMNIWFAPRKTACCKSPCLKRTRPHYMFGKHVGKCRLSWHRSARKNVSDRHGRLRACATVQSWHHPHAGNTGGWVGTEGWPASAVVIACCDNIKMDLTYDVLVWTEFIWLRIVTSAGHLITW